MYIMRFPSPSLTFSKRTSSHILGCSASGDTRQPDFHGRFLQCSWAMAASARPKRGTLPPQFLNAESDLATSHHRMG